MLMTTLNDTAIDLLLDHRQWKPIGAVDLLGKEDYPGTCDRCKRHDLRFLHTVQHSDGGEQTLQVGRECAKRLCYGYNPLRAERKLQQHYRKRQRWLTRNWATSKKGNPYIKFAIEGETITVTIYADGVEGYRYCIAGKQDTYFSPGNYADTDAAKLAAFDDIAQAMGW